jgi:IS5 family transposase
MMRVLLIQQLSNLSMRKWSSDCSTASASSAFVGLRHSSQISNRTTIWTLKDRLIQAGASETVFDAVSVRDPDCGRSDQHAPIT